MSHTNENIYRIPKEIVANEICYHLSTKDLSTLRCVSRNFQRLLTFKECRLMLTKKVEYHLGQLFGEHTPIIFDFLAESGAVISGSTILQGLLDIRYRYSDVDFIVPPRVSMTTIDRLVSVLKLKERQEIIGYDSIKRRGLFFNIREFELTIREATPANDYTNRPNEDGDTWFDFSISRESVDSTNDSDNFNSYSPHHPSINEDMNDSPEYSIRNVILQFTFSTVDVLAHVQQYDLSLVKNTYGRINTILEDKGVLTVENYERLLSRTFTVDFYDDNWTLRVTKYVFRGWQLHNITPQKDVDTLRRLMGDKYTVKVDRLNSFSIIPAKQTLCLCPGIRRDCYMSYFRRNYRHVHLYNYDQVPIDINRPMHIDVVTVGSTDLILDSIEYAIE